MEYAENERTYIDVMTAIQQLAFGRHLDVFLQGLVPPGHERGQVETKDVAHVRSGLRDPQEDRLRSERHRSERHSFKRRCTS